MKIRPKFWSEATSIIVALFFLTIVVSLVLR